MDMSTNKQLRPFGMRDKIGYAFGDFGCNMSFAFINSYLMLFYVTCMKIDPKHFAVLILLGKFLTPSTTPSSAVCAMPPNPARTVNLSPGSSGPARCCCCPVSPCSFMHPVRPTG